MKGYYILLQQYKESYGSEIAEMGGTHSTYKVFNFKFYLLKGHL